MTGESRLYQYEGKIPKSGTKLFRFGTEQYFHRSIAKENLIIHAATKVIIMSMPKGYPLSYALDFMAKHMSTLKYFIGYPREYELIPRDEIVVESKQVSLEQDIEQCTMNHYSDGSCCVPRQEWKQEFKLPLAKSYDLTKGSIW